MTLPTPIKAQRKAAPDDNAPHILVVDDDNRIRDLLARYLQDNGFRVTTAVDAASARACMRSLSFDLLILDVMMPHESGLDFARSLSELIASADPDADRARRAGAAHRGTGDRRRRLSRQAVRAARASAPRVERAPPRRDAPPSGEVRMGEFVFHIVARRVEASTARRCGLPNASAICCAISPSAPAFPSPGKSSPRTPIAAASARSTCRSIGSAARSSKIPANPVYLQTVRGKGYILYSE